ncbi:SGNH/GDSL hydrolase family protein [Bacillus massiliglaciei]|uniref:SGNH/GDSL hydrolase family protein n=1 Tax=Bacillus massiliglaciei TaxID=1816693 RepID=UPI0018FE071F|nr:SGNH/GDSL hydrolase family protein [Bacillus massiliglaciei]
MRKLLIVNVISILFAGLIIILFTNHHQKELTDSLSKKIESGNHDRKVVLLLGSSVTQGIGASDPQISWAGQLYRQLKRQNPEVVFLNLGTGGYTTKDIINNTLKTTTNLNAEGLTPDVIIYETSLINDFQKLNLTQSKHYVEQAINRLSIQFPDAKIYLMPPNDVTLYDGRPNAQHLTYQEYVHLVGDFIKGEGWTYIDFWKNYEEIARKKGLELSNTLENDRKHPNDQGYNIWYQAIKNKIEL